MQIFNIQDYEVQFGAKLLKTAIQLWHKSLSFVQLEQDQLQQIFPFIKKRQEIIFQNPFKSDKTFTVEVIIWSFVKFLEI